MADDIVVLEFLGDPVCHPPLPQLLTAFMELGERCLVSCHMAGFGGLFFLMLICAEGSTIVAASQEGLCGHSLVRISGV